MNRLEAKQILLLYRPGTEDAADPQIAEALELAKGDQDLGRWFGEERVFQTTLRKKFREIPVPAHLKTSILVRQKAPAMIVPPQLWWRRPVWLSVAAAVTVLIGLGSLWFTRGASDRFGNYEARMVSAALREYRMDIVTKDMGRVRRFMADRGAPADYRLPKGLERLVLTGGGLLTWRSNPVAMVCFDRGDKQMLFLFVMNRSGVKDPPAETPRLEKINQLDVASWTEGDKTYVLAGPPEPDFARKYL